MDGYKTLKAGQPVTYVAENGPKGLHAKEIRAEYEKIREKILDDIAIVATPTGVRCLDRRRAVRVHAVATGRRFCRRRGPGGRAPSFDASIVKARIDMIRANQEAALAATSIRAADDMVGELLDVTA